MPERPSRPPCASGTSSTVAAAPRAVNKAQRPLRDALMRCNRRLIALWDNTIVSTIGWADRAPVRRARVLVVIGSVVLFVLVGGLGTFRYLRGFWLYRGFPPPRDPAYVQTPGTVQHFTVASPALGGRRQQVFVYLPPGYD